METILMIIFTYFQSKTSAELFSIFQEYECVFNSENMENVSNNNSHFPSITFMSSLRWILFIFIFRQVNTKVKNRVSVNHIYQYPFLPSSQQHRPSKLSKMKMKSNHLTTFICV